ncbi:MAG: hypothetical protein WCT20_03940 [Candidatus Babeliales bacterium]
MNKWSVTILSIAALGILFILSGCCKTCSTCHAKEMMCSCRQPHQSIKKNNGIGVKPLKPLHRKER